MIQMRTNRYTKNSPPPNNPIVLIDPHKVQEYLNSPLYHRHVEEWDAWLEAQGHDYAQRQYVHMQVRRDFLEKARKMIERGECERNNRRR